MKKNLLLSLALFITTIAFVIAISCSTTLAVSDVDMNNNSSMDHSAFKLITKDEFDNVITPISLELFQQLIIGMSYKSGYIDNNQHQLGVLSTDTNILTVRICDTPVVNNDGTIALVIACTSLSTGKADIKFLVDEKTIKEWSIQVIDSCLQGGETNLLTL